jgi:ATP-binding cassette subfamily C protein
VLTALALSWSLTLLALAGGALVFGLLGGQRRKALALGHKLTRASRLLHGNVQESLAGIKLAKILATEQRQLRLFGQTTERLQAQQLQFASSTSLSRALFQWGGAALLAAYLYLGLSVWQTPVPVLLTLTLVYSRVIPLFMAGHQQLHHWLHALSALQETERLLADCQAHAEPGSGKDPATGQPAWPVTQAIELAGVSVRYAERDQPALDRLSLRFAARTTTAIMGASGAGKSTLADVLMGLLAADSGQLRVDGVPVTGAARLAWRRHVAYVPQEVFLFHDSVRNNLLWGQPDASEADMRLALSRAAADFVLQLPQGLDTPVGDGGVRLSGGERQRLALARALLKRPSLLILDEATSALDRDNEARIRQAIEQLHGDLTVVIIGHRLPTLEHADQVVVLEAGRIRAQGSWAEVRAQQDHDA